MTFKEWFGARKWFVREEMLAGLLFVGAPTLIRLLDDLVRRPRRYGREKLLPIFLMLQPPSEHTPLDGIEARLKEARAAYARVPSREDVAVRDLLDEAVAGLSGKFGRARQIRFPHFSVATWLLGLRARDISTDQPDQVHKVIADEFKGFIERRHRKNAHAADLADLASDLPWWIRVPGLRIPRLGIFLMRRTWRVPPWFATQPLGGRLGQGDFYRLAHAFAARSDKVSDDEVDVLLVDAFLHDLRRAYRRSSIIGAGRRRIRYPTLLIDDAVVDSKGLGLLDLIDRSRNAATRGRRRASRVRRVPYRWDPLLVIATGDEPSLQWLSEERRRSGVQLASPADASYAYESWTMDVDQAGRDRSWLLPLRLERPSSPPPGARDALLNVGSPHVFPLMVTHFLLILLPLAALSVWKYEYDRCWTYPWEPRVRHESAGPGPDQCVGLSSGHHRFFGDLSDVEEMDHGLARQLKDVENKIYDANARIGHRDGYRTLVYLSDLTPDSPVDYRVVLDELRGMAVAQEENEGDVPLRILLANAGPGMDYGRVAAEAIAREAEDDNSLVGVLGLGVSREGTREAMLRLDRAGLPMVGTVISHTGLATRTTAYYHQVGPTNRREAEVIAQYAATKLRTRTASIYYSGDPKDIYSSDLAERTGAALRAREILTTLEPYRVTSGEQGSELGLLGEAACVDSVAVYAGRSAQFPTFLAGMQRKCQGRYPKVIAGDDVTRLVLSNGLRDFRNITVDYVSFASSLAWGPRCGAAVERAPFYARYERMFGGACNSTRDGQAMLAADAVTTLAQAVRLNHQANIPEPSPALVLREIDNISDSRRGAVSGASGTIDYGQRDGQGVPNSKAIMLLRAGRDPQPIRIWLCGRIATARPQPDAECP